MGEKLFTAKEAAEILKVRKNTVYDMIKRGDLKASKLGKQLRIRQEDLDFYIQYGSQAKVVNSMQAGQSSNIEKVWRKMYFVLIKEATMDCMQCIREK